MFLFSSTSQTLEKEAVTMDHQTIASFQVVGISARISNEGDSVAKEVEALWERFWQEDIRNQVPHALNEDIYAVYTDYETDYTGPYTLTIGLSVASLKDIPKGFRGMTIEEDTYQKFTSRGKMPEAVLKTWFEIWGNKTLNRAYRADFTVHGEKYFDGDQAEVETFISINR